MMKVSELTKEVIGEDALIPFLVNDEEVIFSDVELKNCFVIGVTDERLHVVSRTRNQLGMLYALDVEEDTI